MRKLKAIAEAKKVTEESESWSWSMAIKKHVVAKKSQEETHEGGGFAVGVRLTASS